MVLKPGLQTTVQSRSRGGMRHLGVPACGAADPLSLALANRLLGNDWDAPALELTLLGPDLQFDTACCFALAGAPFAATLNGAAIACHEVQRAIPGDLLVTGAALKGARAYLAVAGGIVVEEVLGSASTYLPAGLGGYRGRALAKGDQLSFTPREVQDLTTPVEFRPTMLSAWALRACASFETQKLSGADIARLFETNWTVSRRADRMGMLLEGPALTVTSGGRMPSAAVFPGTVQCPEGGAPFVLAVDAGTTGGYPRIAQLARVDRHLLGQVRPGDHLRFLRREPHAAVEALHAKLDYWRPWLPDIDSILC